MIIVTVNDQAKIPELYKRLHIPLAIIVNQNIDTSNTNSHESETSHIINFSIKFLSFRFIRCKYSFIFAIKYFEFKMLIVSQAGDWQGANQIHEFE